MSLGAGEWRARYEAGNTPWDLGEAHPELRARLEAGWAPPDPSRRRALVPGCGRGHDALALARAGWEVTALDWLDPADGELARALAELGGSFRAVDALCFETERPFDLVFDHTFFCAVDPAQRPAWGALVRRVLAAEGELAALVFPMGKPAVDGGPPFGMGVGDLRAALGPDFAVRADEPVRHAVARRAWPERWAVLARST